MGDEWIARAEALERRIRSGKSDAARAELAAIEGSSIPRPLLARFGELARRAGDFALTLRWLRPVVRPSARRPEQATPQESIEYAAALTRLGAVAEAETLLAPIDAKAFPRAAFERAMALVSVWDYSGSIPFLEAFIRHRETSAYDRLVGKTNLAAALVFEEEHRRVTPLLRTLLHDTSVRGDLLLLGHVYELAARSAVARGRTADAERLLDEAESRLKGARAADAFFLKKWRAIAAVMDGTRGALDRLRKLRDEAETLRSWETCRDCDRLLAIHGRDEALFERVWFGTPHAGFRARLARDFGGKSPKTEAYDWTPSGKAARHVLDLCGEEPGDGALWGSPVRRRAMIVLSADFYRPIRLAALFSALHPEEHFHQVTSSDRVHQLLHALRGWLEAHAPGVTIVESDGLFRLAIAPGWALRVPRSADAAASADLDAARLKRLRESFGTGAFDSREAADRLGISQRTALRTLATGQEQKVIEKSGKRAAARYRFVA